MRALGQSVLIASILLSLAGMAAAAEVRVLAIHATEPALRTLAKAFEDDSGHHVKLTVAPLAGIIDKIKANDVHDVVITAEGTMDRLDQGGIVNPESRVPLAKIGVGVAARDGAPLPDIATPEAFRQALVAASSIAHGDVLPGSSGANVRKMFAAMGVLDAIAPKLKIISNPADSQALLAKGEIEIGLYNISDIAEGNGVRFVGPVPDPLQIATTFEAARMSDGAAVEASEAFIRFIGDADNRQAWAKARLVPLVDR